MRLLQGVSDHHIMPRRGALVVSLGIVNVVMTHRNAYFVVPDGADKAQILTFSLDSDFAQ